MNLNHLAVFRSVADHRSFTAAARALAADKAHVSRVVRTLEESLGVALVTRSTRRVALTPAGEALFATVRGPLDALARAGSTATDRARAPSGSVTLATTPDLGRVLVAPILPGFRARYPEVTVRLRVGPEIESFADPTLDVALRVGAQSDRELRVRKLGELGAAFYASPRYLAVRGGPRHLADLAEHETAWPHGDRRSSFDGKNTRPRPSIACDDFAVVLEIARAGGGVVVLPIHLATTHVREGALVRLFPETTLRGAPLYLVTRRERPSPARVEVFKEHLAANVPPLLG